MTPVRIGSANPLGATCPVCGTVLTLHRQPRGLRPIYVCPAARNDFYRVLSGGPAHRGAFRKPGALHRSQWVYSETDLTALVEGRPSSWHRWQQEMDRLEERGRAMMAESAAS